MSATPQQGKMSRVYKTIIAVIVGTSTGVFGIGQLHLDPIQELLVGGAFLGFVVGATLLYLRSLEAELGISILKRPRLELQVETNEKEKVREVFYSISHKLSSTRTTIKSGETYVILAVLVDHSPFYVSTTLEYLRMQEGEDHDDEASKSADCSLYFDDMVLVVSCGYIHGKEPFEVLETTFKSALTEHNISCKELFSRRPH